MNFSTNRLMPGRSRWRSDPAIVGRKVPLLLLVMVWLLMGGCQLTTQKKTFRIGFSQRTQADTWRKTMLESMNRELSFSPDVEFIVKDAQGQSNKQVQQIQELIDQEIDLLIVSPNAAQPITPIVEKVYQQGIPVIVVDRRTASDQYTAYVGANNVEVGRTAGVYARALLKSAGNVVEIGESPGSSADNDRHRGFVDAIRPFPGIRLVKKLEGDWDKRSFAAELTRLLTTTPAIQLIFAQNDRTALKAHAVCKQLGLEGRVKIIGVDGLPGANEGIDLVNRGILDATVLYPTGGKEAVRTALAILQKQPFRRENRLPITLIDSSNVRIMKLQNEKVIEQQADIEKQSQRINDLTRTYASQKNTLYITLGSLIVAILLAIWGLYLFRTKQNAYQTLEKQNEEILKQKDQIEVVSQQARLATEEKLRFYSYISHEFNTPLSLILTPTEDLLAKKNVSPYDLKSSLLLVQKNAYRLLRLVDQMLDLRKTDAGKLRLRASEQDLAAFVRDIISDFQRKAEKQRIDLQLITDRSVQPVWFDAEKLDKVLFNLLSNAFKYTPKGGYIHVRLDQVDQQVRIQVDDNGEGMTPEEKDHAFDLFFSGTQPYNLAKGLGLALSMEFIELHRGAIGVQSEKGRGTTFTISLPLGSDHLDETERVSTATRHRTLVETDDEEEVVPFLSQPGKEAGTLLVIEDNDDLRLFLTNRLGTEFDIVAEKDGQKGWERALETIPDLVISDIMLPTMDGLQLTQRIKADLRTSHIPVILLTAKGQIEQRIEGTRAGADAYITKPFNTTYLLETLRTTLANRQKLQQRFASDLLPQLGNRNEKKFLNELTALIERHLGDPSFGVEMLSREMGLSRVQLYRKVQALLDMNVMDYLTEIRLKKSKYLLRETNKPIAEIAEETGFNSPAYFTTFFKQHTKRTPSEYRKSPVSA
ncbi:hybrid sensor histidine kinase/response regulator transcription factor [Spirosoma utsteinense]|uniref:histidine kinase n=1 Tax=Spirosoma utsteinense TaxID=2585773 RepID=A0ABR6WCV5_9BACT|nr:signal transduction histidine kinase/DNA-binding response OmpR family regulator [Spirosoma utsteinense]MBC3794399.1 signal transduction histidine kinase/DNA-binding response OmpR family regulator [Spirosoma utsteinense]